MEKTTSEKQRESVEWLFDNFLDLSSKKCEDFLSELQGSKSSIWNTYIEKVVLNAADYGNTTYNFLVKSPDSFWARSDRTIKITIDSFYRFFQRREPLHFDSAFYANELWSILANFAAFYIDWDLLDRKVSDLVEKCESAQRDLTRLIKQQSIEAKERKRLQQELRPEQEEANQAKILSMNTFFYDDIPFEIELFLDGAARLSAYNFIQNKEKSTVRKWFNKLFGYGSSRPLVKVNALVQELQNRVKNEMLQRGIAAMYQNYFGGSDQESQKNSRFERSLHEWLSNDFTPQEIDKMISELRSLMLKR